MTRSRERKSGVAERNAGVVTDMGESWKAVVTCLSEAEKVTVGLHLDSAWSSFLFTMMMDRLSNKVGQKSSFKA